MIKIRLRGDDFLIAFGTYYSSERGKKTSEYFNTPHLPISNLVQSRILNHWEKEGVLNDKRKDGKGWRKYSFMEIIWIYIVIELREFNFSLSQIVKLKEVLEEHSDKVEYSTMPELELYVRHTLSKVLPIYLLVFPDGDGLVGFKDEIEYEKEIELIGSHISINLNAILGRVLPNLDLKPKFEMNWKLSKPEEELLIDLRSGRYKEIEIETKEGKIKRYTAKEVIEDKVLFRTLALEHPFQKIETEIKDNKTVAIKRSVSKKFK